MLPEFLPPANSPRVDDAHDARFFLPSVESAKSTELPVLAIVIYSKVLATGVLPKVNTPRVSLDKAAQA